MSRRSEDLSRPKRTQRGLRQGVPIFDLVSRVSSECLTPAACWRVKPVGETRIWGLILIRSSLKRLAQTHRIEARKKFLCFSGECALGDALWLI